MIQPTKNIKKTLEEKGYPFKSKQFSEVFNTYMKHQQEVRNMIEKINYDVDGTFWGVYVNGESAVTGVDSIEVTEGATYTFKVETGF